MVPCMGIGAGELIVIAFVLVVVFSASRMGQLGNAIGRFVYSFRRAVNGHDLVDVTPSGKRPTPPEDAQLVDHSKR
jgi:sec-independent protein translocase protein TatA